MKDDGKQPKPKTNTTTKSPMKASIPIKTQAIAAKRITPDSPHALKLIRCNKCQSSIASKEGCLILILASHSHFMIGFNKENDARFSVEEEQDGNKKVMCKSCSQVIGKVVPTMDDKKIAIKKDLRITWDML